MAFVLAEEMVKLAKRFGIEKLGFLTLTFADNVQSIKEAQRRFNSLNTGVIKARYSRAIGVWERQKSGRIHFHLVVVLGQDIRSGFDFEALTRQDYRSANSYLRSEWSFWRKTAPRYGFGRTELLPVKSNAEGIARYVGGYVKKHIEKREERDKGARVVRFLGYAPGDRTISARFSWATDGGWLWRHKLKAFCKSRGIESLESLRKQCGPRWAWRFKEEICAMQVEDCHPSEAAGHRSFAMCLPSLLAFNQAERVLEGMTFTKSFQLQAGIELLPGKSCLCAPLPAPS